MINDPNKPADITDEAWRLAYDFLSDTKTAQPIEGLDFVIVREAMARAIMASSHGKGVISAAMVVFGQL